MQRWFLTFDDGQELDVGRSPARLQAASPERAAGGGEPGVGPPLAALPRRRHRETHHGEDGDAAGRPVSLQRQSARSDPHLPGRSAQLPGIILRSDQLPGRSVPPPG